MSNIIAEDVEGAIKDINEKGLTAAVHEQMCNAAESANKEITSIVGWFRGDAQQETPDVLGAAEVLAQVGGSTCAAYGVTQRTTTGGIQAVWVLPEEAAIDTVGKLSRDGCTTTTAVDLLVDQVMNGSDHALVTEVLGLCASSSTDGRQLAEIVCEKVRKLSHSLEEPEQETALVNYLTFVDALHHLDTDLARTAVQGVKAKVGATFARLNTSPSCRHLEPVLLRIGFVEKPQSVDLLGFDSPRGDFRGSRGTSGASTRATTPEAREVVEICSAENLNADDELKGIIGLAAPALAADVDLLCLDAPLIDTKQQCGPAHAEIAQDTNDTGKTTAMHAKQPFSTACVALLVDRVRSGIDSDLVDKILDQCASSGTSGEGLAAILCDRIRNWVNGRLSGEVGYPESILVNYLVLLDMLSQVDTDLARISVQAVKMEVGQHIMRVGRSPGLRPFLQRLALTQADLVDLLSFDSPAGHTSEPELQEQLQVSAPTLECVVPANGQAGAFAEESPSNWVWVAATPASPEAKEPISSLAMPDLADLVSGARAAPVPLAIPAPPAPKAPVEFDLISLETSPPNATPHEHAEPTVPESLDCLASVLGELSVLNSINGEQAGTAESDIDLCGLFVPQSLPAILQPSPSHLPSVSMDFDAMFS